MLPVPLAELTAIQADMAAAVCDKPCAIERKTTMPDGLGSETEDFVPISPPDLKAGMAQPTGAQLQNFDYLIGSLKAWQVHFPVGTDVRHQDHLLINGQTLVVQVLLDLHSYPALLTVLASEVQ